MVELDTMIAAAGGLKQGIFPRCTRFFYPLGEIKNGMRICSQQIYKKGYRECRL